VLFHPRDDFTLVIANIILRFARRKDQVRHRLDTSIPAKLALFARLKSTAKRLCGASPHLGGRRNQPRYDQGKWTPVQESELTMKCFFHRINVADIEKMEVWSRSTTLTWTQ
jgi:hypothetical protein